MLDRHRVSAPGISEMALYLPPHRIDLKQWCDWTGNDWSKVSGVVGRSFRMCAADQDAYTMAAQAVLELLIDRDIDPQSIGFLALGTESSTDNSAGAVIVRGLIDQALLALGRPRLSRHCEVPEFKHACLGGVYALKGATRYLKCDGRGRNAIVVCSDRAEYDRGSSGEQTQGAGAVAILLEPKARLLALDLDHAGSSSAYRGVDFRKPFARHFTSGYATRTNRLHDFPVFNGKYSTHCYIEATLQAFDDLVSRSGRSPVEVLEHYRAFFFHRPYHWMPIQTMARLYVWAMARERSGWSDLAKMCERAEVDPKGLVEEASRDSDLFELGRENGYDVDPSPLASQVARVARREAGCRSLIDDGMGLGADAMMEMGNLYTAALPAWIAAGLEDAWQRGEELEGEPVLLSGYGSGDAAEVVSATVVEGWTDAASRLGVAAQALLTGQDVDRYFYEALHDGFATEAGPTPGFRIASVGKCNAGEFLDIGIDYYEFEPGQGIAAVGASDYKGSGR